MEQAKNSVYEIADWFLAENKIKIMEGDSDFISNLKLQKLLYYAQGAFLAFNDRPAFRESIFAWDHGPVVPEIYHLYKEFGSKGIDVDIESDLNNISEKDQDMLRVVFNAFGIYSAWKLRDMTHLEDPWKNIPRNNVIVLESIKDFFEKTYVEK